MSTALASARRRRAGPEVVAPPPGVRQTVPQPSFPSQNSTPSSQPNMAPGLTLPQVISLVDRRLSALECFMQGQVHSEPSNNEEELNEAMIQLKTITEEYNTRFDIIADELALLKDTVLKLQTFTMEVNRSLMQDRIRILSDEPNEMPLEEDDKEA